MMKVALNFESLTPLNDFWSFGGNTCHAALWFRQDLQNQLKLVNRQLGFKYVRCHGILNDDMEVIHADGSFSFQRIIESIQAILDLGMKPFIELSSMPTALASNDKSLTAYCFRSAPPNDWGRWHRMIHEMTLALEAAFGLEEMRQWYFEVWNEPDIGFWSGTQAEYFKLYDLSAQAVKAVDPQLKFGGPATARTNWIDEFLEHLSKDSPDYTLSASRCDFISTHAYPSDLEFLDAAHGEVNLMHSNIMAELFAAVRTQVDAFFGEGFPIIIGEWNSSAGPLSENHDTCNNAAFICKTMVELMPYCQGSLVWNISDIYEECGFHYEPFHGGYGLLTVNDLPKACFHGFRLLAEHSGAQIEVDVSDCQDGVGAMASCDGDQVRILLYFHEEPGVEMADFVEVNLTDQQGEATMESVLPGAGSAYETWLEQGSPAYLNREIFDTLEQASKPKVESVDLSQPIRIERGSVVQIRWVRSSVV